MDGGCHRLQHVLPKDSHCLPQPLCFKRAEILLDSFRGILQTLAVIAAAATTSPSARSRKYRKMSKVRGDNYVSTPANRRGENVSIIGIWKVEPFDQISIAGHQGICRVEIHQHSSALQFCPRQIGTTAQERANPLVMYRRRPLRAKQAGQREMHEEISQVRGIQDARIVKSRKAAHGA